MHITEKQTIKPSPLPHNWKKEESVFTGDCLIDAYLKGKRDGKNEMIETLAKQFNDNMAIATSISEKLYAAAADRKINFKTIHVRAEGITKFSALVIAKKEDFLSDEFRGIFTLARKLKNEVESDSFYISFSFMPHSDELNEKCITADGFFLKYEKE
ncbi:hypothetical protein QEG73_04040 [Chitinophagaceae bacterium 26-R-25]|nr:hypothetical protein [Chitinophagaceae bacterium 26-R-25]